MPTGGVSQKSVADFIQAGSFALGVGADLVDLKVLRQPGGAAAITERAREYVRLVREARRVKGGE
jgi:2-dehydro-3-deoxyphosphogluconate aldolase/(4S)-4-hydroxy-2-oxoglutarate aldolase